MYGLWNHAHMLDIGFSEHLLDIVGPRHRIRAALRFKKREIMQVMFAIILSHESASFYQSSC
jgi:hypothetical protein